MTACDMRRMVWLNNRFTNGSQFLKSTNGSQVLIDPENKVLRVLTKYRCLLRSPIMVSVSHSVRLGHSEPSHNEDGGGTCRNWDSSWPNSAFL